MPQLEPDIEVTSQHPRTERIVFRKHLLLSIWPDGSQEACYHRALPAGTVIWIWPPRPKESPDAGTQEH